MQKLVKCADCKNFYPGLMVYKAYGENYCEACHMKLTKGNTIIVPVLDPKPLPEPEAILLKEYEARRKGWARMWG